MSRKWLVFSFLLTLFAFPAQAGDGGAGFATTAGTLSAHMLNAGSNWGVEWLNFCGYNSCGDGGGGLLHRETCTPVDNGLCFQDSTGRKFKRMNLNGHLAQYGVTFGSTYDCNGAVSTCQGSAGRLLALLTAAAANGLNTIYGDGLQIKLSGDGNGANGNPFVIDGNVCFDNGTDGYIIDDPIDEPGVIWTEGTTVIQLTSGGCLKNAAVAIAYYPETYPSGATTVAQKYAIRQYMTDQGQTGVSCTGNGCTLSHVAVLGYDNPVEVRGPNTAFDHLKLDGNVGFYAHDIGAGVDVSDLSITGVLTRGEETNAYYSIDNITCNAGLTRVKVRTTDGGGDLSEITDGIRAWISGLTSSTGAANAWDSWIVTKIASDTFDLQGSVCSGANLDGPSKTASADADSWLLTGVSDQSGILEDMIVSGSGCLQGSTHVSHLWPAKNIIVLDKKTTCPISSVSLTFSGGPLVTPTTNCDGGSGGGAAPCFILAAALRFESGDSPAGVAAGHEGVGVQCGEPIPEDGDITHYKVAAMTLDRVFMYGVSVPLHISSCEHLTVNRIQTDSTRKVRDSAVGGAHIEGDAKSITITNGGFGKTGQGFGILVDAPIDESDQEIGRVTLNNVPADLEVNQGSVLSYGTSRNTQILVANDASSVHLIGDFNKGRVYYEGAAAQEVTDFSNASISMGLNAGKGQNGTVDARMFAADGETVTVSVLQAALDYASANHIPVVKLGAQSARIDGNITTPSYVTLDLGAANVGKLNPIGDYRLSSGIMGALGLTSSATITCGVGSGIINGSILADGGSYSPTTFYAQTTRDGQNVQAAEASAGTAITASNPSCRLQNLSILGFNVGVALSTTHTKMVDVNIDSKTCVSMDGAEDDQFDRVICKSFLTAGLDKSAAMLYLDEVGGGNHAYEVTWDVSAATYTFVNGDKFYYVPASGGGGESAAGGWTISGATTRANGVKGCNRAAGCPGGILTGSSKSATTLSATWTNAVDGAGDYFVTITPNIAGTVSPEQAVSGTNIASGGANDVRVSNVWNEQGRIYLVNNGGGSPFTGSGSGTSLTFTDHAFSSATTGFIEAGERTGAGFDCTNSSGMKFTDSTAFSHSPEFNAYTGCRNIRIVNFTTGTNDSSLDDGQVAFKIWGDHSGNDADSIYVISCNCGQHANVGFYINSDSNKANFLTSTVAAPGTAHITGTSIDVEDGSAIISSFSTGGSAANVFIADGADVDATGITNVLSHFYVETPLGTALNGVNNTCSNLAICNRLSTLGIGSASVTGSISGPGGGVWNSSGLANSSGKTVATLTACTGALKGYRNFVTDSNAAYTAGIGATVVGGGANVVPVFCDGSAWKIGALDPARIHWPANDNSIIEERRYG